MTKFLNANLPAALLLFTAASCRLLAQGDKPLPPEGVRPSPETIQAWQARKFGMFIHFGVYSSLGGVWQGRQISNGYSEQIQSHAPISQTDYEAVAKSFNPLKFDPEAIVKLAQDAGMKFIVLTSKHHDGFNMFHTKLTDYNIVDYTPFGKDVVKLLSAACARHGMKFGVYYSSIDWHYPGHWVSPSGAAWEDSNENPIPRAHEDFNVGQLQELASNYGPLSEIWFDMGRPTPAQSKRFAETVHAIQPKCLVSGRIFNYQGDFTVMGDNEVADFVIDEPWQTPASIYTDTWGYRSWAARTDLTKKIDEHILNMAQVVSRGGNYLLNIGPRGDGTIVEFEADVLRGVGKWLHANADAIYGVEPQPFRQLSFGYATVKPGKLFLLIRSWPKDGHLALPGLSTKLTRAYALSDSRQKALVIHQDGVVPYIQAPPAMPASPLTVLVAEYAGALSVVPPTEHPDAAGAVTLTDAKADHFFNYNGYGYDDPATVYKQTWAITLPKAARYRIEVLYSKPIAPQSVTVTIDGQRLNGMLDGQQSDANNSDLSRTMVGEVNLAASKNLALSITPPQPFVKGTKLGVKIMKVILVPTT